MAVKLKQVIESTTANDASAARDAAHGTLAVLLLRLLSFGCTQWTFRILNDDIAALGRASITLELLLTTTLFVSREGFRLSLTRNQLDNWNVAWLSIPVSTVASVLALLWHLYRSSHDDNDFRYAGILYCLAAWMEGLAEPCVLYWLRKLKVSYRVSAEGAATVVKTLATVIALNQLLPKWPVLAFGIAQLCYGFVYMTFLYVQTWPLLPLPRLDAFDAQTCFLTFIFTVQGLFKHLLTEGDRIVLAMLSGSYDQGVYAMGSSYGGLAARIILQPLEENARLLWSQLQSAKSRNDDRMEQSYIVLVKLVLYIGFTFSCFATNYTSILLNVLAGHKWGNNSEATDVLSAFCIYTSFLAWNGMTEGFIYGVANSGSEVGRLGLAHAIIGVLFAIIAPVLVSKFGTTGLVAANCFAMFLRSIYSVSYAVVYFSQVNEKPVWLVSRRLIPQMFPHWGVMLAFATSGAATRLSLNWLNSRNLIVVGSWTWYLLAAQHVAIGAASLSVVLALAILLERDFRISLQNLLQVRAKED